MAPNTERQRRHGVVWPRRPETGAGARSGSGQGVCGCLRQVAAAINRLRSPERSFVLITHYRRLLDHVAADRVHVMVDGRIAASGDMSLVDQLEERGYEWVGDEQPALAE